MSLEKEIEFFELFAPEKTAKKVRKLSAKLDKLKKIVTDEEARIVQMMRAAPIVNMADGRVFALEDVQLMVGMAPQSEEYAGMATPTGKLQFADRDGRPFYRFTVNLPIADYDISRLFSKTYQFDDR